MKRNWIYWPYKGLRYIKCKLSLLLLFFNSCHEMSPQNYICKRANHIKPQYIIWALFLYTERSTKYISTSKLISRTHAYDTFYRKWSIRCRAVYSILGAQAGAFIDRRRLKERFVYSHNCNKLHKNIMLSANTVYIPTVYK